MLGLIHGTLDQSNARNPFVAEHHLNNTAIACLFKRQILEPEHDAVAFHFPE